MKKKSRPKANGKKADAIQVKASHADLPGLIGALNDIGRLRVTLPDNIRLHNLGKPVRDQAREAAQLQEAVLTPYRGEGGKIARKDIPEATAKVMELRARAVEFECPGPPFDLTPYLPTPDEGDEDPTRHRLATNTLTDLLAFGLVKV
jgi:hypothetical protein